MKNIIIFRNIVSKIKMPIIVFIWVLIWEFFSRKIGYELLLPSPFRVGIRLTQLMQNYDFWYSIGQSLMKIMQGFFLAVVIGSLLAFMAARIKLIHMFFYPVFSVVQATPVASFIILALVWVKSSYLSMFCVFLMVVPMVYSNVYTGLKNVDIKLVEVGSIFALSKKKMIRHIYFPSVLPYFLSSCTVGLGFAWKSGIAAEVIGLPSKSIGIHLYDAKIYLETVDLFAWTFVIVVLSVTMEKLVVWAIGRWDKKRS